MRKLSKKVLIPDRLNSQKPNEKKNQQPPNLKNVSSIFLMTKHKFLSLVTNTMLKLLTLLLSEGGMIERKAAPAVPQGLVLLCFSESFPDSLTTVNAAMFLVLYFGGYFLSCHLGGILSAYSRNCDIKSEHGTVFFPIHVHSIHQVFWMNLFIFLSLLHWFDNYSWVFRYSAQIKK